MSFKSHFAFIPYHLCIQQKYYWYLQNNFIALSICSSLSFSLSLFPSFFLFLSLVLSLFPSPFLSLSLKVPHLMQIIGRFRPCFCMNANITLIGNYKISGNWLVTQIKENLWHLIIQISLLWTYLKIGPCLSFLIYIIYIRYKSNTNTFVKL